MTARKKGFKELVEGHPITVVTTAAAAAVAATFSITSYLTGSEEKIHQLDFQHQLTVQKESFGTQIANLQNRLSSIERKTGKEDTPAYLDLSRLTTTSEALRSLAPEFQYFSDIEVYISVPPDQNWQHELTNELQILYYFLGKDVADLVKNSPIGKAVTQAPIHLWTGKTRIEVETGSTLLPKVYLFPFVAIESVDNAKLAQLVGNAVFEERTKDSAQVKKLDELTKKLSQGTGESQGSADLQNPGSAKASDSETRLAIIDNLSNVFRSDLTGVELLGQLQGIYQMTQVIPGSTARVLSAEKKGNVFYAHLLLSFYDQKTKSTAFWDREIFFVSGPTRSVFLATGAPSLDHRSVEAAWITSWLGSVRIPLE